MAYVIPPMVTDGRSEIDYSGAGITGGERAAKRCRKTIASGDWDGLCNRERESAGRADAGTTHERFESRQNWNLSEYSSW